MPSSEQGTGNKRRLWTQTTLIHPRVSLCSLFSAQHRSHSAIDRNNQRVGSSAVYHAGSLCEIDKRPERRARRGQVTLNTKIAPGKSRDEFPIRDCFCLFCVLVIWCLYSGGRCSLLRCSPEGSHIFFCTCWPQCHSSRSCVHACFRVSLWPSTPVCLQTRSICCA